MAVQARAGHGGRDGVVPWGQLYQLRPHGAQEVATLVELVLAKPLLDALRSQSSYAFVLGEIPGDCTGNVFPDHKVHIEEEVPKLQVSNSNFIRKLRVHWRQFMWLKTQLQLGK